MTQVPRKTSKLPVTVVVLHMRESVFGPRYVVVLGEEPGDEHKFVWVQGQQVGMGTHHRVYLKDNLGGLEFYSGKRPFFESFAAALHHLQAHGGVVQLEATAAYEAIPYLAPPEWRQVERSAQAAQELAGLLSSVSTAKPRFLN